MYDYHFSFHQILGHLTTIRSAGSVISTDHQSQLPSEVNDLVEAINQHSSQLVTEINQLRDQIYKQHDPENSKK